MYLSIVYLLSAANDRLASRASGYLLSHYAALAKDTTAYSDSHRVIDAVDLPRDSIVHQR